MLPDLKKQHCARSPALASGALLVQELEDSVQQQRDRQTLCLWGNLGNIESDSFLCSIVLYIMSREVFITVKWLLLLTIRGWWLAQRYAEIANPCLSDTGSGLIVLLYLLCRVSKYWTILPHFTINVQCQCSVPMKKAVSPLCSNAWRAHRK